MSIDARLSRLMPGLSAKERAILVLRSLKDKTPEDPLWRRTMPQDQTREFNRLIVLMNACNIYLPLYITVVEQFTERVYAKYFWWMTMSCFGSAVWQLGSLIPASKRKQAERMVAGSFPILELPWDADEHTNSWVTVADDMEKTMREELQHLWEDVQAIDIVVESVAVEFDGEDPLRPVMRGVVEKTRKHLRRFAPAAVFRELPWDAEEHTNSWVNVSEDMERTMREELQHLWADVQAIDMVVESVAVEFDGEDPLRPIMRGAVEKTRKHLSDLHQLLSLEAPLELTGPDEEALDLVRTYFELGKELMAGL